jgi:hypothetical protein
MDVCVPWRILVEHEIDLNDGFVLAFKYQEHIF